MHWKNSQESKHNAKYPGLSIKMGEHDLQMSGLKVTFLEGLSQVHFNRGKLPRGKCY